MDGITPESVPIMQSSMEESQDPTVVHIHIKTPPGIRVKITVEDEKTVEYSPVDLSAGKNPEILTNSTIFFSTTQDSKNPLSKIIQSLKLAAIKKRLNNYLTSPNWNVQLLALSLIVYLVTHFIGLENFPIYFFTDEAVGTVRAADFVRDGFRSYEGEFLPTFFENNSLYPIGVSVYIQILPYILFGKSIFITRATCVILTFLTALWLTLILRNVYKITHWWLGPLVLSITPTWFLHSRTAFEYCLLVTFYSGFLYYYLMYRTGKTHFLYFSLAMGALAFYSYMPGQIIMVVSGLLLLIGDCRYHWQERKTTLRAVGVLVIVALPFIRFLINHPTEYDNRLNRYGSYWADSIPLFEKIIHFISEYLAGLNPFYWFFQGERDISRHIMLGYGHILWVFLPFALIGLWLVIQRNSKNGTAFPLLVCYLAVPTGAAMVALGVTRAMTMIVPILILSAIGISEMLSRLAEKFRISHASLGVITLVILTSVNIYMLRDALVKGPTWFDNYGLTGMQYGARQIFPIVQDFLAKEPNIKIELSPNWTNGADVVMRFFLPDPLPLQGRCIDTYENDLQALDSNTLFIMTPEEYDHTINSPKFKNIQVENILPYPNGKPGFYFLRLEYADNIEAIFEQERIERRKLLETPVLINGKRTLVQYATLDIGEITHVFDGDDETLIRTREVNPLPIKMKFDELIAVKEIDVRVGGGPTTIYIKAFTPDQKEAIAFQRVLTPVAYPRTETFILNSQTNLSVLEITVENTGEREPSHVHVWEIALK